MKVLLTDDVVGLGDIGETVKVKPGYARNFLIPRGFAVEAGAASAKFVAHRMKQIDAKKKRLQVDAEKEAQTLAGVELTIPLRVGRGGKVFGSVTSRIISEKLAEAGKEVDRRRILLTEPIKKLGKRDVRVKLHADVIASITVEIVPEAASVEEEQIEADEAKDAIEAAADARLEADLEEAGIEDTEGED